MRDEVISKIRDELAEGPVKSFVLIDGVVYNEDTNQNRTLYVPSSIRNDLIKLYHEKLGHLAAGKCYNNIKSRYWFPLMRTEIDELIRNCVKCILHSVPKSVNNRILHSIPKVQIILGPCRV